MATCAAASVWLAEIAGVTVDCKCHVAAFVSKDRFLLGGQVIQKLPGLVKGGFCGPCRLGGNGTERDKESTVDSTAIEKKFSTDLLNKFLALFLKYYKIFYNFEFNKTIYSIK